MVNVEKFLLSVSKPAQYLGNELNSVIKDKYVFHMCLAFPGVYQVGMSSIGYNILYNVLNNKENVYTERSFAPEDDMEQVLRENDLSLFSLETKTALNEFDAIGFSISYEMSYINVMNMLNLAKMEIESEKRKETDPIIIVGGIGAFNPLVMKNYIDVFVVGEGEEVILEISDVFIQNKNKTKDEKLKLLSKIKGVYVPKFYDGKRIKKRVVTDLEKFDEISNKIVPYVKIVHDRIAVEIQRGCTRGCRFCQAGMIYRPIREKSLEGNMRLIDASLKSTGYNEVSLSSLSSSDYSCIDDLINKLIEKYKNKNVSISLPSLRMEKHSVDITKKIQEGKKTGFTFAPEAGSQKLRDIINKNVTEEEIIETAVEAVSNGWTNLKFYFMIGLPFETYEDITAIKELVEKTIFTCREITRNLNITVSISNFVPKAHTPYQWMSQMGMDEMREKHNFIKKLFGKLRWVTLKIHSKENSYLEGFVSRGDEKVGELIKKAWENGAKLDPPRGHNNFERWLKGMEDLGLKEIDYLGERSLESELPWDIIDIGVTKDFMVKEYKKSESSSLSKDCREGCINCGICYDFDVEMDIKSK